MSELPPPRGQIMGAESSVRRVSSRLAAAFVVLIAIVAGVG